MTDTKYIKIYKATFRFPTEQFAYMEVQAEGTPQSLKEQYLEFERTIKVGEGLPHKEWNECLDKYREGKGMSEECYSKMNKAQIWLIHELDKSDTRIKHPTKTQE